MAGHYAAEINGEEDENEALRIAIALSLGQDPGAPTNIDLTQEDECSLVEPSGPAAATVPVVSSSLSTFGLDRKKMEEERLARANKRKASELNITVGENPIRPQQRQKIGDLAPRVPPTADLSLTTSPVATAGSSLQFPRGIVKKTWVYRQPRLGDDIKIEEVLQKDKLELAVLSSFQWDDEWMLSKIDIERTKIIIVAFATDEAHVSTTHIL